MNFSAVPKLCLCLILSATLVGCGGVKQGGGAVSVASSASLSSAMDYYLLGSRQVKAKDLTGAAKTLGDMEIKYPLNLETGELYAEVIEGYYEVGQPDQVIDIANRFTTMFPSHKNAVNAHYFAGMVDYERGRKNISMDVTSSDPTYAKAALARFNLLLQCCGGNEYAHNAKQYIYHLESMISLYELRYMERDYDDGRIDAAAARGISLMLTYPDSVAAKRAAMMLSSNAFNKHRAGIESATAVKLPVAVAEVEPAARPKSELGAYAVYLASAKIPEELKAKVASMGLAGEVDYYKKTEADKTYFFAAYGNFTSRDEAGPTQLELRVRTDNPDLWVRKLENSEYVENIDLEKVVEKFYAIQVMSVPTLEELQKGVDSLGLAGDVVLYSQVVKGKTSYIALYGKYSDWSAGKVGLAELERLTGKTGYWLRNIDSSKVNIEVAVVPVKAAAPEPVVMANVPVAVPVVIAKPLPVVLTPPSESKPVVAEKFYGIQMMSFAKLDSLQKAVDSMGLADDVALFRHVVKGKTFYIAVYGKYSDWSAGKIGLAELEQRTGKTGYWLRKIDSSKVKSVD